MGEEGYEGDEGEQDCQGQAWKGRSLRGAEGEDLGRPDEVQSRQEQVRQGRGQSSIRSLQEEIRGQCLGQVVGGGQAGAQGDENYRVRPDRRQDGTGQSAACQGEVLPRMKIFSKLQSRSCHLSLYRACPALWIWIFEHDFIGLVA